MIFNGSIDDLKKLLSPDFDQENFTDTHNNKWVVRLKDGAILNWYTTTGRILIQGTPASADKLTDFVNKRLAKENCSYLRMADTPSANSSMPPNVEPQLSDEENYLFNGFDKTELFIGVVSPVGTPMDSMKSTIKSNVEKYNYKFVEIHLSNSLNVTVTEEREYNRIKSLIDAGDKFRETTSRNDIMAMQAVKMIAEQRKSPQNQNKKLAFFINSLKHPDEVQFLRKVYGQTFYLVGIHADINRRIVYLTDKKHCSRQEAEDLILIDENENIKHGQKTRDTFHQSDFFINVANNGDLEDKLVARFFEMIFSYPFSNPLFDEFAMFMAFSSSVRSSDLSRQVGAVLTMNNQIIATGVNDCPKHGGGQYWTEIRGNEIADDPDGKDYMVGHDANKLEQQKIIDRIITPLTMDNIITPDNEDRVKSILANSGIKDLIEFGRVVHAEMEAILSCARAGINTKGATLYCTTFPCHNCAKHIIDAGITRVVYVEPYPKSKALELHNDSIELACENNQSKNKVIFEPFQGVAARRFLDLFSMNLGTGSKIKRKDKDGNSLKWDPAKAVLRVPKPFSSYKKLEDAVLKKLQELDQKGKK